MVSGSLKIPKSLNPKICTTFKDLTALRMTEFFGLGGFPFSGCAELANSRGSVIGALLGRGFCIRSFNFALGFVDYNHALGTQVKNLNIPIFEIAKNKLYILRLYQPYIYIYIYILLNFHIRFYHNYDRFLLDIIFEIYDILK